MPAGTKVASAEAAIRKSAESRKGVKDKDAYVYGTLNKMGLMRGNKPTRRGLAKARKPAATVMRRY